MTSRDGGDGDGDGGDADRMNMEVALIFWGRRKCRGGGCVARRISLVGQGNALCRHWRGRRRRCCREIVMTEINKIMHSKSTGKQKQAMINRRREPDWNERELSRAENKIKIVER